MEKDNNNNKKKATVNRSEEVRDIIDRMPMTFGRWVAIAVVVFAVLLLVFGWVIRYPDTVTGQIKINSDRVPVKLIANASGKLHLLDLHARDEVKENDYVAVIQNSADTKDMQQVSMLINQFNPNQESLKNLEIPLPEKVSLGELNLKYYTFLSALKGWTQYEEDDPYGQQASSLREDIRWKEVLQKQTKENLETTREKLEITRKWYDRDASLNKSAVLSEQELDATKNAYLSARQGVQSLEKELSSIGMELSSSRNQVVQLNIERREKEKQLRMELLSSYHDLTDNIKLWEQHYVFKAPFDGQVEFLKFWTNDEFVQQGEEVFSIVPGESQVRGQVLLPSAGAGKVSPGCKVTIKLDNYPYLEFGSVEGVVGSMSLITRKEQVQQGSIDTYLIIVDLPQGLTTNYGETLDFRHEIGGIADIIVRDRRLIERLFDNLRYRTKAK